MKKQIVAIKAGAALKAVKALVKADTDYLPLFKGVEKSSEIDGETAMRYQSHPELIASMSKHFKSEFGVALPEDHKFRTVQDVVDCVVEATKSAASKPGKPEKAEKLAKEPKGEKPTKSTFKPKKGDQFRLQDCKDEDDNGTRVTFVRVNKEEADSFIVEDKKGNLYDAGEENLKPIRSRKAE